MQPGDVVLFQKDGWNVVGMQNIGKYVVVKKEEKKIVLSVRKVQLRKYGKGLKFNLQFLSALANGVSLEAIR